MNQAALLEVILAAYRLPVHGCHGVAHWARVLENGIRVGSKTGADLQVVTLFAMFHDSRRVNEGDDDGHGKRGGDLARKLRGSLIHLDDARFELLYEACRRHTDGLTTGDRTLEACWDADRLDLGRVGIRPLPRRLCTDEARSLVPWAHARAVRNHAPKQILKAWGFQGNADESQGGPRRN